MLKTIEKCRKGGGKQCGVSSILTGITVVGFENIRIFSKLHTYVRAIIDTTFEYNLLKIVKK